MKRTSILLTLLMLATASGVFAQKTPKTATDFFAALPSEYMTGTRAERLGTKDRQGYITTFSVTPDFVNFILFEGNVPQYLKGTFAVPEAMGQLKLFRAKNRTIIGLSFQVSDKAEANPTTDSVVWHMFLLEYKGGKWLNVTSTFLPKVTVDEAYKVLTEDLQIKDVKKEDVRVEAQISKDKNILLFVAKRKGDDSVTTLKFYKWSNTGFVETGE